MKEFKKIIFLSFILLICGLNKSFSQSELNVLKTQKKELSQAIKKSQAKLIKYKKIIDSSSDKLSLTNAKLLEQNKLLKLQETETRLNQSLLKNYKLQIDSLDHRESNLKSSFNTNINRIYMQRLSAKNKLKILDLSMNKGMLRNLYLKQYDQKNIALFDTLKILSLQLDSLQSGQQKIVQENKIQLSSLKSQRSIYSNQKKTFRKNLKSAKKNKNQISKNIASQKKSLKYLESKIFAAIKKASSSKKINAVLSNNFSDNQGKFPTPLDQSVVVSAFGEQSHPLLPNIKIFNNGIDLLSNQDTNVNAIFDGQVLSIQEIPGAGKAIIIQHGIYYSVYGKLDLVEIKLGDLVISGQNIGKISTTGDKKLHFELWKNQEKLNPELWLNL